MNKQQKMSALILLIASLWGAPTLAEQTAPPALESQNLYPPAQLGAASQKIPPGAKLKVKFMTPLDSRTAIAGDPFIAVTSEDLWIKDQLIVPKGLAVRGRVETAQKPGFFSKGGLLKLSFDHLTMPSGELKPLSLEVNGDTPKMSMERNALYTDPGMGNKLNASVDKGIDQYKYFHEKGIEAGKKMGGGVNMLLTVPTNTIAGVATGTAVTTVNAAKALVGKGEPVSVLPGEELTIDLYKAATLQEQ